MNLSTYIDLIMKSMSLTVRDGVAVEITVSLDERAHVNDKGSNKVTFTLLVKDKINES